MKNSEPPSTGNIAVTFLTSKNTEPRLVWFSAITAFWHISLSPSPHDTFGARIARIDPRRPQCQRTEVLPLRGTALLQIQRIRLRQEAAVAEERMNNCCLSTSWWQPGVKTGCDSEFVPRRSNSVTHTGDHRCRRPGRCSVARIRLGQLWWYDCNDSRLASTTTGLRTAATEDDRFEVCRVWSNHEKLKDALRCACSTLCIFLHV
jgi:hypothetical protein